MSVEDIVLDHDGRGISALRSHLPDDFCHQAARLILENPGAVIIATGFYIAYGGAPETDGPIGALVIGTALRSLGYEVVHVTDRHSAPVMTAIAGEETRIVEFPIADDEASRVFARTLLSEINPSVVISIERCGMAEDGLYRNMLGQNISEFNAKLDYLFTDHPNTVAIGDGGNEIGMGNLADVVSATSTLVDHPCVTRVSNLIIASVSNWGGYGLVAAMSAIKETNLLPSVEAERDLVIRSVAAGAVDGMSGKSEHKVDGFTLEENSRILERLHLHLAEQGITQ